MSGLTGKQVTLIDDMSTVRKVLTWMLEGFGVEVLPASDAGISQQAFV